MIEGTGQASVERPGMSGGLKLFQVGYARQVTEFYLYYVGAHDQQEAEYVLQKLLTTDETALDPQGLVERVVECDSYKAKEWEGAYREPDITCWEI